MKNDKVISNNIINESRWAKIEEIKSSATKINLNSEEYDNAGLPVICDGKTAYVDATDTHTIVFGSTGSKKTRLFCMPMINMMIKAGESYIVTDPKGELFTRTSASAQNNGYKVVVLNFRDIGKGDCWNPLEIPYELYNNGYEGQAISLLNDFIASISAANRNKTNDMFWVDSASSLVLANLLTLMTFGTRKQAHVGSLAKMCSNENMSYLGKIAEKMNPDSIAGMNYNGIFTSPDRTLQNIEATLYAWLRIFITQPELTKMLSRSTFDIRDFGKEKTAVYLIVPDEKPTYHFFATIFIKQVYETLSGEAQKENNGMLPIRLNFVLDEFCNIPTIPDMSSMISAARSRNMRYYLIVQGLHQLRAKYGDDADTIKGNCENWVFLTSKELELLREISELCGTITVGKGEKRSLISTSELQRLDKQKGEALILYGRKYPFITEFPDIDEYKMFETRPSVELEKADFELNLFSTEKLLEDARSGKVDLFSGKIKTTEKKEEIKKDDIKSSTNHKIGKNNTGATSKIDLQAEIDKKYKEMFGKEGEE